jgi:hypothetical protein
MSFGQRTPVNGQRKLESYSAAPVNRELLSVNPLQGLEWMPPSGLRPMAILLTRMLKNYTYYTNCIQYQNALPFRICHGISKASISSIKDPASAI